MVRSHQRYYAPDSPIGLQKLVAAPTASNSLQTVRSDSREQIIFGMNEP